MDLALFVSTVFTLTLVMDPLGNVPLFVSALRNVEEGRRRSVILRELFIALGIMVFFLLFGKYIVSALSLDTVSMSVAGGIVLFLIALQMIFPSQHAYAEGPEGEPFIVPLAIPLIAGPSTLSMVMLFSMREPGRLPMWFGVVGAAWLVNAVILAGFSGPLSRLLGRRGLLAMERLMGMILVTISVQMIMTGIKEFLAS